MVSTHGGKNFLHQHPDLDQLFLVLDGEATFYTGVDEVGAVLGRWEGVIVPRGTEYWYEATPGKSVVLLRVGAHPADGEAPLFRLARTSGRTAQSRPWKDGGSATAKNVFHGEAWDPIPPKSPDGQSRALRPSF